MSLIWRIRSSHVTRFFPRFHLRLGAPLVTRQSQLDALYATHLSTAERFALAVEDQLANDSEPSTSRDKLSRGLGPKVLALAMEDRLDTFSSKLIIDPVKRRRAQVSAGRKMLSILLKEGVPTEVVEEAKNEHESRLDAIREAEEKHERWTTKIFEQIEGARQDDQGYLSLLLVALLEMEVLASEESCDWYERHKKPLLPPEFSA